MITEVFSIYDSKAKLFFVPFFSFNKAVAQRQFAALAQDSATTISKSPEDFSLHHIGSYDDELALLIPCIPENLGLASLFQKGQS